MMWYYGGPGSVLGWMVMTVSMVVFWAVVVGLIVWLVRQFRPGSDSTALSILKERFARGEINREEYEQRKVILEGR